MTDALLDRIEHRPWPLPDRPWSLEQSWHDLLFAHWPVSPSAIARLLPPRLELDLFEGSAWLGVVPFRMSGVRPRLLPAVPWLSNFPELNLRTYVHAGGKRGVWFFALEAHQPVAVALARKWFGLPYFRARMECRSELEDIEYCSERTHSGENSAEFKARYGPRGAPFLARPGTLKHFLTERYCLFAQKPDGILRRGDIHHAPWPLQPAEASIELNTLPQAHGFDVGSKAPHLLFARDLDVVAWTPVPV